MPKHSRRCRKFSNPYDIGLRLHTAKLPESGQQQVLLSRCKLLVPLKQHLRLQYGRECRCSHPAPGRKTILQKNRLWSKCAGLPIKGNCATPPFYVNADLLKPQPTPTRTV